MIGKEEKFRNLVIPHLQIQENNLNSKIFLAKNLPTTYLILQKINWYIKIELTKNASVNHLDYSKNKASWSYIKNYNKLNEKIENQLGNMNELYNFLKDNNIKLSILIYPHQASIKYDIKDCCIKKFGRITV